MAITATQLAAELGVDSTLAARFLAVSSALVDRYASGAPQAIKDEAVIRTAGYLAEHPGAAVKRERTGDISTTFMPNHLSALRHSGSMSLLSPWKVRRAGAI